MSPVKTGSAKTGSAKTGAAKTGAATTRPLSNAESRAAARALDAARAAEAARIAGELCRDARCTALAHRWRETTTWKSVCFDSVVCWNASLILPHKSRGPSAAVWTNNWGEGEWLLPLYERVLGGSCTRSDGTRKVVVDIGANIGMYSVYMAMRGCEVHAFEPLSINADHLELTARTNGLGERLHLHRLATSDDANMTNLTLRWSHVETGLTHVVPPSEKRYNDSSNQYVAGFRRLWNMHWNMEKDVRAGRVDNELRGVRPPILVDWMKVDVEGSELAALCSASGLFAASAISWLGFEVNTKAITKKNALGVKALLEAMGMEQRVVPGIPKWQWSALGWHTGYMVMYARTTASTTLANAPPQGLCRS